MNADILTWRRKLRDEDEMKGDRGIYIPKGCVARLCYHNAKEQVGVGDRIQIRTVIDKGLLIALCGVAIGCSPPCTGYCRHRYKPSRLRALCVSVCVDVCLCSANLC